MASAISSSSSIPSRPTYSCIRCADRKVKCDRQRPCSACVRHNVDCLFNASLPARPKRKRAKDQILSDRIKYYEALLQEQGIDPNKLPGTPESKLRRESSHSQPVVLEEVQLQTPPSVESEQNPDFDKPQVVHDEERFKFVDNSLWARVVEEMHDPKDALEDSSDDASELEASDDDLGFVLSNGSKSKLCHPSPECIYQLWQIFVENIDPLTKVVHTPTLQPAIYRAVNNIENVPRNFEALMFAIYSAAVMSLKDDECEQRLCEPRKTLLSRYISATKATLARAKFMGTTSLVVLQALVLHLISVRDIYEPRVVWSLTGVAVRVAQSMGLERDGRDTGLPLFETEMRRRIWWLLKTHDFRTAELCGLAKFRGLEWGPDSTQWPTNVNDDQLYPGMSPPSVESNKLTDMAFVSLRYELMSFAAARIAKYREQGKGPNQWDLTASGSGRADMDEAIRNAEETVEAKYVRYGDPAQPLHLMTMLMARYSMNTIRFLTHHPRKWVSIAQTPYPERQFVWETSIKLLEQHNMVLFNAQLKRFAWHGHYFQQWHAFIHVLDTLRVNPLMGDAEKAWQLIGNIYRGTPDMVFNMKKPIHVAVGNLCLKAYGDREAGLKDKGMSPEPTPEFILQIRQQRDLAKARKQARDIKSSPSEVLASNIQGNAFGNNPHSNVGIIDLGNALASTFIQPNNTAHPSGFGRAVSTNDDELFWLNDFDNGQVGDLNDVLNMDLELMLAEDHSMEDSATETINWKQWDAWLANSNLIPALSSPRD